jgi:hypothetical protein
MDLDRYTLLELQQLMLQIHQTIVNRFLPPHGGSVPTVPVVEKASPSPEVQNWTTRTDYLGKGNPTGLMTEAQEAHLKGIKYHFEMLVDEKYRKGQREHGGDLFQQPVTALINMALDEAVDQVVYLLTLRDRVS